MKFLAVDIVYQRFVSDYSLAIASVDLTDISCSDPDLVHILNAFNPDQNFRDTYFSIKIGIQFTPPSLDNAACQVSVSGEVIQ